MPVFQMLATAPAHGPGNDNKETDLVICQYWDRRQDYAEY